MRFLCVALCFLCSCFLFADQIQLKNGDKLTGTITKLDSGKVTIKTDYADDVTIKWDAVSKINSDNPIYIPTANQKEVKGTTIERQDNDVVVSGPNTPETRIPVADVSVFRGSDEEKAYQHSLHPGILQDWNGGANFGLAIASGNSDTKNVSAGLTLSRETLHDKISMYLASVYANDAILNATTSNAIHAGARYDHNLTKKLFAYGSADFVYDELQGLNLGSIIGGGLGYHLIDKPTTTLDILGGISWTRQAYIGGVTKSFPSAQIGEEFTKHLFAKTDFKERGFFYPDLTNSSQYNAALDAGLDSTIYKRLTWNITFSDRYTSYPLPGKKDNDLIFSTGLGVTIGKGSK